MMRDTGGIDGFMLALNHVQFTASARVKSSSIQIRFNDGRATQDAALDAPFCSNIQAYMLYPLGRIISRL